MSFFQYEELASRLRKYTSERRHRHSLNVMEAALALAAAHAPEIAEQAGLAGLLHDNAKKMEDSQLLAAASSFGITPSVVEQAQPSLLHGKVGAALLFERFNVSDPEVALAVADHVTGRPGMGKLSRILYVADQAAADRSFAGVELLRKMAPQDLELSVLLVARNKLLNVVKRGYLVEPDTAALYNEQVMRGLRLPAEVLESGGED